MRGSPRSLWLSWANTATSMWTSAATAAMRRNQRAFMKAMTTPPKPASTPKKSPTRRKSK